MNWKVWIKLAGADQVAGDEAKDKYLLTETGHAAEHLTFL